MNLKLYKVNVEFIEREHDRKHYPVGSEYRTHDGERAAFLQKKGYLEEINEDTADEAVPSDPPSQDPVSPGAHPKAPVAPSEASGEGQESPQKPSRRAGGGQKADGGEKA